ncbi:MAG: hypothetical protein M5R36_23095 [Deltaproteobacteria bacterium]|nr:hypothetical protein [Deltaproteobacteria bacterium]
MTRFRGFRGPTAQLATVSATLDDIPGLIAVGLLACFWSPGVREASALAGLGWLGLSVVTGAIGGLVIILFLSRTHNDQTRLLGLMGALSVGGGLTAYLHLSPLFVGAVMGALYVNVSRRDDHVFNIVTRSESTFYVLFLILVGSLLQFRGEDLVLGMAVYLVVRIAAKAISGFLFLAPARNVERPSSLVGLALLSQGGMAIAMAAHYGAAENSVVAQSAVSIVILGVIMNELYGEPLAAWVVGRERR